MEKVTEKIKPREMPERRRYLERVLREAITHAIKGEEAEAEYLAKEIVLSLTGKKCSFEE